MIFTTFNASLGSRYRLVLVANLDKNDLMCFICLDEILEFLFSLDSKNLMVTKPGPYLTGGLDPSIASPSAGFRCYPQPQVLPSSVS